MFKIETLYFPILDIVLSVISLELT